jgi:hypothetical protein
MTCLAQFLGRYVRIPGQPFRLSSTRESAPYRTASGPIRTINTITTKAVIVAHLL